MKLMTLTCRAVALALGVWMAASAAQAGETTSGDLTVHEAQARPNLPNRPTAAYMAISNAGDTADRLVAATSGMFGTIELHTSKKQGGVMMMMPVDGIDVPAGESAVLEPGGLHLMLFDGKHRLKVGDSFPLTLTFERAGDVTVEVKVAKISGGTHQASHGDHGGDGHGEHSGHKKHND